MLAVSDLTTMETVVGIDVTVRQLPSTTVTAVTPHYPEERSLYQNIKNGLALLSDNGFDKLLDLYNALWLEVRYLAVVKSMGGYVVSEEFKGADTGVYY